MLLETSLTDGTTREIARVVDTGPPANDSLRTTPRVLNGQLFYSVGGQSFRLDTTMPGAAPQALIDSNGQTLSGFTARGTTQIGSTGYFAAVASGNVEIYALSLANPPPVKISNFTGTFGSLGTPIGRLEAVGGLLFYNSGRLYSLDPNSPTGTPTQILTGSGEEVIVPGKELTTVRLANGSDRVYFAGFPSNQLPPSGYYLGYVDVAGGVASAAIFPTSSGPGVVNRTVELVATGGRLFYATDSASGSGTALGFVDVNGPASGQVIDLLSERDANGQPIFFLSTQLGGVVGNRVYVTCQWTGDRTDFRLGDGRIGVGLFRGAAGI